MNDLAFDAKMPRGYSKNGISREVWTAKFFQEVNAQRLSQVGTQHFVFPANDIAGKGARLMLSRRGLNELITDCDVLADQPPSEHPGIIRKAVTHVVEDLNGRSWVTTFKALVKQPKKVVYELGMNLDDILSWQQATPPPAFSLSLSLPHSPPQPHPTPNANAPPP